jgi:hypothetical protein
MILSGSASEPVDLGKPQHVLLRFRDVVARVRVQVCKQDGCRALLRVDEGLVRVPLCRFRCKQVRALRLAGGGGFIGDGLRLRRALAARYLQCSVVLSDSRIPSYAGGAMTTSGARPGRMRTALTVAGPGT